MLTHGRLCELLTYNNVTGEFTRKVDVVLPNGRTLALAGSLAGGRNSIGYWRVTIDGKAYNGHRLAWLYMTGAFPDKPLEVDHINGVRSDNRRENLRACARCENLWNAGHRKTPGRTSSFKWVSSCRRGGWMASVRGVSGDTKLRFNSEVAAAFWADRQARALHGEFAKCNFPPLDGYAVLDRGA